MCLFNNYAQMLKRQLRFLFQTTLFKNYQQSKTKTVPVGMFRDAINSLAFNKSESPMVLD